MSTQRGPMSTQGETESTQPGPVSTQGGPVNTQPGLVSTQPGPVSTQGGHSEHPGRAREHPRGRGGKGKKIPLLSQKCLRSHDTPPCYCRSSHLFVFIFLRIHVPVILTKNF